MLGMKSLDDVPSAQYAEEGTNYFNTWMLPAHDRELVLNLTTRDLVDKFLEMN